MLAPHQEPLTHARRFALLGAALLMALLSAPLATHAQPAAPTYTQAAVVGGRCTGDAEGISIACSSGDTSFLEQAAELCGVAYTAELNANDPRQADCILAAMSAAGASDQAQQLFQNTHLLLRTFIHVDGLGPIDIGVANVPWVNMGRDQIVFLNGSPPAVPLFSADLKDVFLRMPDHDTLVHRNPRAGPWFEYSGIGVTQPLSDGGEMIVLTVPLKVDRPSPALACMPVEFTFDTGGTLVSIDPLASEASFGSASDANCNPA